jgi:macrolide-specific efflux system membrane fusion protein
MGMLSAKWGPLFVWQALVVVVLLASAGGGTYVALSLTGGSSTAGVSDDEQLVPAQFGDLVSIVSTDGSLIFPEVEEAVFTSAGTVGEVLAVVGDTVTVGQPLATLDAASIAALEKAVAEARVALRDAEAALEPDELATAKAEAAVTAAQVELQAAEDDVAEMGDGPSDGTQSSIEAATVALTNAQLELTLTERDQAALQAEAQETLTSSKAGYRGVYEKWLGIDADTIDDSQDSNSLFAEFSIDLVQLYGPVEGNFAELPQGSPPDDPTTAWSEPTIYSWLNFYPGAIVPTCSDGTVPTQGVCVQLEFDVAWDTVTLDQNNVQTVDLAAAKAITADEVAVANVQAALDAVTGPLALAMVKADLAVAQANLKKAQADLTDLNGGDILDRAVLEANAVSAALALETAVENLEGATLVAPIAGVVVDVTMEAGQVATGNASGTITIVDRSIVEMEGTVDEIDVLSIGVGVNAAVTMSALSGQTLLGTVTEIGNPSNQQGVVTFPISVRLDMPDGLELLEGLTATASVVISEELDVLRVPTTSIQGTFLEPFVRVFTIAGVEDRPVQLGSSDDFWVVVTGGLSEGEQVAMPAPSAGQAGFGAFTFGRGANAALRELQGRGGRGGGGGGGGGGRGRGNN